ncbi:hypothetical protein [Bifidobacterium actinocoloniiforme]|uniref:hypothetical protein n=1 Tax=Bifidobacterium actinocoloniiforme TaxID=638619 RepID=UPI0030B85DBA
MVFLRGAAFHKPDPLSFNGLHTRLCEKGYMVAVPEYRPSEETPFAAQTQDAKTAIRFIRAQAGTLGADSGRIAPCRHAGLGQRRDLLQAGSGQSCLIWLPQRQSHTTSIGMDEKQTLGQVKA